MAKIQALIFYLMEIILSNNNDFDNYLKKLGYKFKNENQEFGGYIILKNKKTCLIMDVWIISKFINFQKIINLVLYRLK